MGFDREPEESFDYLNAVKNGSPAEIARQVDVRNASERRNGTNSKQSSIPAGAGEVEKSTGGENAGHRAAIPKKKQQEEDLELLKKPKRSRGFGMGM